MCVELLLSSSSLPVTHQRTAAPRSARFLDELRLKSVCALGRDRRLQVMIVAIVAQPDLDLGALLQLAAVEVLDQYHRITRFQLSADRVTCS